MKKNKILVKILALVVACTGLLPNVAALAETNNQSETGGAVIVRETENQDDEVIDKGKVTTTTGSAVVIEPIDVTPIEEPIIPVVDFNNEIDKANEVLSKFKATNNITEQDVVNAVKNSVDSSISVTIKDKLDKRNSTVENVGSIIGTLVISDLNNSRELKVVLQIEKLEIVKDDVVTALEAKINGLDNKKLLYVGNKATVDVTGYNAEGKKVDLDLNQLSYKWFVKTEKIQYAIKGNSIVAVSKETVSNELIGENKNLEIKDEFRSDKNLDLIRTINCDVNYDDGQEGGVK